MEIFKLIKKAGHHGHIRSRWENFIGIEITNLVKLLNLVYFVCWFYYRLSWRTRTYACTCFWAYGMHAFTQWEIFRVLNHEYLWKKNAKWNSKMYHLEYKQTLKHDIWTNKNCDVNVNNLLSFHSKYMRKKKHC